MITIDIEEAGYQPKQVIILNVRFTIPEGQIIGLIGGMGQGKVRPSKH